MYMTFLNFEIFDTNEIDICHTSAPIQGQNRNKPSFFVNSVLFMQNVSNIISEAHIF